MMPCSTCSFAEIRQVDNSSESTTQTTGSAPRGLWDGHSPPQIETSGEGSTQATSSTPRGLWEGHSPGQIETGREGSAQDTGSASRGLWDGRWGGAGGPSAGSPEETQNTAQTEPSGAGGKLAKPTAGINAPALTGDKLVCDIQVTHRR